MHPLADTGRVIAGRYRLQAPIGRGAMGVVWRARDQLLDRDVAVKEVQIADTLTAEERATAYQRTLREAKTAARLNHPAVVTVYDVAEDGGRPWIVMQLVSAQSLDQVIATSGPLSPRRAAEMARQLLSALTVAHAAGVMHRDVKPSNVLIGSDDRAVLTDFGIATFQGDPKLTQTGMVMGSPGFTAPERIRGEDASPASDLWSLGATIFAAVEGHGPFEKRGGAITTMSAIINEDAPEAPTAGPLAPVIAALLRREPVDRPDASTATRMITDVLPLLAGRAPGAQAGYEPTALSASSPPASPRPRTPAPGETALDVGSAAEPGRPRPVTPGTGPPGSAEPFTGPTAPQPVAGYEQSPYQQSPYEQSAGSRGRGSQSAGSPPDFSSWYNQSPRSGAASSASQSGAPWSGSSSQQNYPEPRGYQGYAPQGWSGSASQQATPPWSGGGPGYNEPPQRQRSGLWWKIAIVVLAIVGAGAGAATVVLLHQSHNNASPGQSSAPPTSPGTNASPAQIIDAVNQPSGGALPAGYTTYSQPAASNEQAGFSLAAPISWKASTSGYQTYLRDPSATNVNILIDLTPHTHMNDMLQEATYIKNQSLTRFPGYTQLGLARLTIRGQPGAYWKFTWDDSGTQQEAIDLLWVAPTSAGNQSYALYMTAPASIWSDSQIKSIFDEEVRTFQPMPR